MADEETLAAEDVLEYIEDVMSDYKLRPAQKINTLIEAIEADAEEAEAEEEE